MNVKELVTYLDDKLNDLYEQQSRATNPEVHQLRDQYIETVELVLEALRDKTPAPVVEERSICKCVHCQAYA